jgi:hypothetical protein
MDPMPAAALDTSVRVQELSRVAPSTARTPAAEIAGTSRPIGASPIDDEAHSIASTPFVAPQPVVRTVSPQPARASTVAPFIETTAREAEQMQPVASRLEHEPPRQNPSSSVKRPEPIAAIRPVDVARPITQTVPTAPPPRSEIRIGTISLEVHVPPAAMTPPAPAPSVAAPPPTPAAAATPASTRFSLHRHYVRWG